MSPTTMKELEAVLSRLRHAAEELNAATFSDPPVFTAEGLVNSAIRRLEKTLKAQQPAERCSAA